MSTSYLNLLAIFSLFVILTQGRPERHIKECSDNNDCAPGFSCMHANKLDKQICAKLKSNRVEKKVEHHIEEYDDEEVEDPDTYNNANQEYDNGDQEDGKLLYAGP